MPPPAPVHRITVLSGGVGGARFLQGLWRGLERGLLPGVAPGAVVTVVANTGDDWWVHGLKICPDLDTVMYTLGDGIDHERGWGRRHETWHAKEELAGYGVEPTWFGLGDRDLATHLVRTQMLDAGYPLSQVTEALCRRWLAPTYGDRVRLLPMTDDRVATRIATRDGELAMQEWFVRERCEPPVVGVRFDGAADARPAPGVLDAIADAETVLVCPSNPVISIGPILAVPGVREALVFVGLEEATPAPGVLDAITDADLVVVPPSNPVVSVGTILGVPRVREALVATRARVVGLSPIVGGHHLRGMAEQLLTSIGVEVSAAGVGLHYGARSDGGVLDAWLVDETDAADVPRVLEAGLACRAVPLLMTDVDATAAMAAAAVELVS